MDSDVIDRALGLDPQLRERYAEFRRTAAPWEPHNNTLWRFAARYGLSDVLPRLRPWQFRWGGRTQLVRAACEHGHWEVATRILRMADGDGTVYSVGALICQVLTAGQPLEKGGEMFALLKELVALEAPDDDTSRALSRRPELLHILMRGSSERVQRYLANAAAIRGGALARAVLPLTPDSVFVQHMGDDCCAAIISRGDSDPESLLRLVDLGGVSCGRLASLLPSPDTLELIWGRPTGRAALLSELPMLVQRWAWRRRARGAQLIRRLASLLDAQQRLRLASDLYAYAGQGSLPLRMAASFGLGLHAHYPERRAPRPAALLALLDCLPYTCGPGPGPDESPLRVFLGSGAIDLCPLQERKVLGVFMAHARVPPLRLSDLSEAIDSADKTRPALMQFALRTCPRHGRDPPIVREAMLALVRTKVTGWAWERDITLQLMLGFGKWARRGLLVMLRSRAPSGGQNPAVAFLCWRAPTRAFREVLAFL